MKITFGLTSIRIHSNLFACSQSLFDVALLDALNAEVAENHLHVVGVNLERADALLAAFPADQVVWMRPKGGQLALI